MSSRTEDDALTTQPMRIAAEQATGRLPVAGLLALAMTGFVAIMTETLPAGLLPMIANGLGVTDAAAGQLVTVYAAGSLVAAIPLVTATLGWRRRPVLLLSVAGLLLFNTITALSADYLLTLTARFFAGVSAGLAWGLVGGYARRLVARPLQGRALALAMIGTPIALSLGLPLGTLGGHLLGWRITFLTMSVLTLVLIGWILWRVPDFAGQAGGHRMSARTVLLMPGMGRVLFVVFAWMTAHNLLYTFIAPFAARAGLSDRVGVVLLLFGASAMVGIWITARLVDRLLRASVLACLSVFVLVATVLIAAGRLPAVVLPSVALWGLTFGGAATLLNTAAADAADGGVDIALALVTTVWNLAIAAGGIIGGVILARADAGALPWAVLASTLLASVAAWRARASGFPPGPRRSAA